MVVAVGVAEALLPEYEIVDQVRLRVLDLDGVNCAPQDLARPDISVRSSLDSEYRPGAVSQPRLVVLPHGSKARVEVR
jgi:hypothetical protein